MGNEYIKANLGIRNIEQKTALVKIYRMEKRRPHHQNAQVVEIVGKITKGIPQEN